MSSNLVEVFPLSPTPFLTGFIAHTNPGSDPGQTQNILNAVVALVKQLQPSHSPLQCRGVSKVCLSVCFLPFPPPGRCSVVKSIKHYFPLLLIWSDLWRALKSLNHQFFISFDVPNFIIIYLTWLNGVEYSSDGFDILTVAIVSH